MPHSTAKNEKENQVILTAGCSSWEGIYVCLNGLLTWILGKVRVTIKLYQTLQSTSFSCLFLGEPGMWMISADNILQTDVVTGVGVARSPGTATIFHDIPGLVKTYREVNLII